MGMNFTTLKPDSRISALKIAIHREFLTNVQIIACIEILASRKLSPKERRQAKSELLQILDDTLANP
jgi:hypothetical protein